MRRIKGKLFAADRSIALILLAHNPKVAGSNPAPATSRPDKRLTIGRTSRGAVAPRLSVQTATVFFQQPYPGWTATMVRIAFDLPEGALSGLRLSPNEF